jgi:hypothetical protein
LWCLTNKRTEREEIKTDKRQKGQGREGWETDVQYISEGYAKREWRREGGRGREVGRREGDNEIHLQVYADWRNFAR